MLTFGESGHPVFRATSPLARGTLKTFFRATSPLSRGTLKSRGGGILSIHCADWGTIETVFRTIISVNQLSIFGAVSELYEECKSCPVRTGRPVLVEQSDPLFVATSVMKNTYIFDR